jgi:hypothetical protein
VVRAFSLRIYCSHPSMNVINPGRVVRHSRLIAYRV